MSTSLAITVLLTVLFTLAWHDQPARNLNKRPPTDPKVPTKRSVPDAQTQNQS
jgi:hypothetical protein